MEEMEFLVHNDVREILLLGENSLINKKIAIRQGLKINNMICLTNLHNRNLNPQITPFETPLYRRHYTKKARATIQPTMVTSLTDKGDKHLLPHTTVSINNNTVEATIDMGNPHSLIDQNMLKRIHPHQPTSLADVPSTPNIVGNTQILGKVKLKTWFKTNKNKKHCVQQEFGIVRNPDTPIIFGCPTFLGKGLTLDLGKKHIHTKNGITTKVRNITGKNAAGTPRVNIEETNDQRNRQYRSDTHHRTEGRPGNTQKPMKSSEEEEILIPIGNPNNATQEMTSESEARRDESMRHNHERNPNQTIRKSEVKEAQLDKEGDEKDLITNLSQDIEVEPPLILRLTIMKPFSAVGASISYPTIEISDKHKEHYGKTAVIQPIHMGRNGEMYDIQIAHQVVTLQKRLKIKVINLHKTSRTIRKFSTIGLMEIQPMDMEYEEWTPETTKTMNFKAQETHMNDKDDVNNDDMETKELKMEKEMAEILKEHPWIEEIQINKEPLSTYQRLRTYRLFAKYNKAFSKHKLDVGRTDKMEFEINMKPGEEQKPIYEKQYRLPIIKKTAINELIEDHHAAGIIEPSTSPWNVPMIAVKKPDGSVRPCADLRKVNDKTLTEPYGLRDLSDCIDCLGGNKYYSTFDLGNAFLQLPLKKEHRKYTAFTADAKRWQWTAMPFGAANATFYFCKLMHMVLGHLDPKHCLTFVDDIAIYSKTIDEHLIYLEKVLERLQWAKLKLKPKKCYLFMKSVKYLGNIISEEGIRVNPEKIRGILKAEKPTTPKQVKSFLAACAFWKKHIPGFMVIAAPLFDLLQKDKKFIWTAEREEAYKTLMGKLIHTPVLRHFDPKKKIVLMIDSSDIGIGSCILQMDDKEDLYVVSYYSRKFTPTEKNQAIYFKELQALIDTVIIFDYYLRGMKNILVLTDNSALSYLLNLKGKLAEKHMRWLQMLALFDLKFIHVPGKHNVIADWMSRACKNEKIKLPTSNRHVCNFPAIDLKPEIIEEWKNDVFLLFQTIHKRLKAKMTKEGRPWRYDQDNEMKARTLYGALSEILSGKRKHYSMMARVIHYYTTKYQELLDDNDTMSRMQFLSKIRTGQPTGEAELGAIASIIKCPIFWQKGEMTKMFFPTIHIPGCPVPPLGTIIELEEVNGNFTWKNKTLTRTYQHPADDPNQIAIVSTSISRDLRSLLKERATTVPNLEEILNEEMDCLKLYEERKEDYGWIDDFHSDYKTMNTKSLRKGRKKKTIKRIKGIITGSENRTRGEKAEIMGESQHHKAEDDNIYHNEIIGDLENIGFKYDRHYENDDQ